MGPSARAIAEQASFQAFLHGYLQEVDPGDWQTASQRTQDPTGRFSGPWVCELTLNSQRSRLAIDILYRSAGPTPLRQGTSVAQRSSLLGRHRPFSGNVSVGP